MYTKTLDITVSESVRFPTQGVVPLLLNKIQERLVFTNPEYEVRHLRGEWLGNIAPQIHCLRKTGRHYIIPRGFLDQLLELCDRFQQPYRLIDRRRALEPVAMEFHGQLKDYQLEAAEGVLERDSATLVGGYKSGKTVIALYTIAQRRQPTLILIPHLDLMEGWLTKIENFLQIPRKEVGLFIRGSHKRGDRITIAHTGEILRQWKALKEQVGYVILDECQRCPSKVFTHLIPNFDSRYMLGLTNATQRRDRLSQLIYIYLGDVVYSISEKDAREGRGVLRAEVVARATDFDYPYESRADYPSMMKALMTDEARNRLIADDVEAEIREGNDPLVILTGGREQDRPLGRELERRGISVVVQDPEAEEEVFAGDAGRAESVSDRRREELPEHGAGGRKAILVTPKALVESSQKLSADVLFLAVPVYFRRGLTHAVRSLPRTGNGDTGTLPLRIYDYVDQKVGLFENYFRMRSYNYGVHPDTLLGD